MKKYVLLAVFTFIVLAAVMMVNSYVIFPGLDSKDLIKSITFFEVVKICGIEAIGGAGITWVIGMLFFSEKD